MIVGMNFTSIKAYTKDQPTPKVNVNSAPRITGAEEFEIAGMKDLVKVNFNFVCEYSPDVGKIEMDGNVLWRDEKAKEIIAMWKADKKLDTRVAAPILNAVFRRCLTKTVELSDELRLPPPLQFPVVVEGNAKAKEQKSAAA